jgi:hypothetical protein
MKKIGDVKKNREDRINKLTCEAMKMESMKIYVIKRLMLLHKWKWKCMH